ncbi:Uncharacterized protein PPKH_4648 [Pseudomonas putida]|nr:Uncharacterized protein PPKH_4648 [Pseudomonas putida]
MNGLIEAESGQLVKTGYIFPTSFDQPFSTIRHPPLGVYLYDSYNQPISPSPRHRTHD